MTHGSKNLISFLRFFHSFILQSHLIFSLVRVNDMFGGLKKIWLNFSHRIAGNVSFLGDDSSSFISCRPFFIDGFCFQIFVGWSHSASIKKYSVLEYELGLKKCSWIELYFPYIFCFNWRSTFSGSRYWSPAWILLGACKKSFLETPDLFGPASIFLGWETGFPFYPFRAD